MRPPKGTLAADWLGICPGCGKHRFSSRAQAKRAARAMPGRYAKLRAYRCGDYWHLTSAGTSTTEWYRRHGR